MQCTFLFFRRISCIWSSCSGVSPSLYSESQTVKWHRRSVPEVHSWFHGNAWNQQETGTERKQQRLTRLTCYALSFTNVSKAGFGWDFYQSVSTILFLTLKFTYERCKNIYNRRVVCSGKGKLKKNVFGRFNIYHLRLRLLIFRKDLPSLVMMQYL